MVNGIQVESLVNLGRISTRKARVAVAGPLHGRSHAIAIAEIDVVSHADLVAVIENGLPGRVKSRLYSNSAWRRSLSIRGANRLRIPRLSRMRGFLAYSWY